MSLKERIKQYQTHLDVLEALLNTLRAPEPVPDTYTTGTETADNNAPSESPDLTALERTILEVLTERDAIEALLEAQERPDGRQTQALLRADYQLYELVTRSLDSYPALNSREWRYLYPDIPASYWWWFVDKVLLVENGRIVYRKQYDGIRILGMIILVVSVVIAFYTTQQLFINNLNFEAVLKVLIELFLSGVLLSYIGQRTLRSGLRTLGQILQPLIQPVRWISGSSWHTLKKRWRSITGQTEQTLHRQTVYQSATQQGKLINRDNGASILAASLIMLIVSIVIPVVILPLGANLTYQMGQHAHIENRDLETASYYYDLSLRLYPTIPVVVPRPNVAASFLQIGELYLENGDREGALTAYRNVLAEDSRMPAAMKQIASLLIDSGDYEEALRLTDRADNLLQSFLDGEIDLPISLDDARVLEVEVLYTRARVFLNQGFYLLAEDDLDKAGQIIQENETLFISPSNNTGHNPFEVYYLRAYTGMHLTLQSEICTADIILQIYNDLNRVETLASKTDSSLRRQRAQSARSIRPLFNPPPPTCEQISTGEIEWPLQDSY